jgi:hypothetical protein
MRNFIALGSMFFLGVSAFAATQVNVSETEERYFRPTIGFGGGVTFSNISAPADINTTNYTGFAAGVNAEFPLSPMFSFLPEAFFVHRGTELTNASRSRVVAKFNALEFPVLAKLKLDREVSPYIIAGPMLTLNISTRVENTTPAGGNAISFNPRTFDVGATAGLGVDIGAFFANARYLWGLTSVDENSADWKARGVNVLAGLRF